jgi:aryl-alcohol dehydrogenase-like predicted oxidoreductase
MLDRTSARGASMLDAAMPTRPFGRTGLDVSVMGFGAGGFSRAGLGQGEGHAAGMVAAAIEAGVNVLDTAEMYGTEPAVAAGIGRAGVGREAIVISTKVGYREGRELRSPAALEEAVRERLRLLRTEYVDVLHVHGVTPEDYERVRDELRPVLERLQSDGVVRWAGITEGFGVDTGHRMLQRAIADGCWDVVMVGFNLVNQSARERVLAPAREAGIGVMDMFAVRGALRDFEVLTGYLERRIEDGQLGAEVDVRAAVATLRRAVDAGAAASLTDLAYRFVREEPGIDTVLIGTGNPEHLRANRESFLRPPLPDDVLAELRRVLAGVDTLNAQEPRQRRGRRAFVRRVLSRIGLG